ncbi:MAG: hypothetical protein HYU69_12145 [Bacteroidetes bacterium]|nr:hypothetical protein [Bacteroidota bacterium]
MKKTLIKYGEEYNRENLIEKISQYSDLYTKEQLESYSINELLPIFHALFVEIRERMKINNLDLETFKLLIEKTNKKIGAAPDQLPLVCYRGLLYGKIGEYEKAVEDFSFLILQSPRQWDFYYLRAYCYFFLNQFSEARQDLLKGLSLENPEKFEIDKPTQKNVFFNIANEKELLNMKRILDFEFNYNFVSLSNL